MMTAYSSKVADWGGSGYGSLVSVPQASVGVFASVVPWEGAR